MPSNGDVFGWLRKDVGRKNVGRNTSDAMDQMLQYYTDLIESGNIMLRLEFYCRQLFSNLQAIKKMVDGDVNKEASRAMDQMLEYYKNLIESGDITVHLEFFCQQLVHNLRIIREMVEPQSR